MLKEIVVVHVVNFDYHVLEASEQLFFKRQPKY